jgi:hypothetical protein
MIEDISELNNHPTIDDEDDPEDYNASLYRKLEEDDERDELNFD